MTWNIGVAGESSDVFSISELEDKEKAYTWIGDIALLTKSEYIRSHSNDDCLTASALFQNRSNDTCKSTTYFFTGNNNYWLLTPTGVGILNAYKGFLYSQTSNPDSLVFPVLYLKSNITLTGNGTNDENIYKIVS